MTHYFKSFSQSPKGKDGFKSLSDVSADITIVDSLSESAMEMELDSINTTIASGAMNALMSAVTPGRTSTPKCSRPDISSLETESDTQSILSSQD